MIAQMLRLSGANPGAITFLLGIVDGSLENSIAGIIILPKVERLGIIGTDLFVLWSDIANRDYALMAHLCREVPNELLKKASSKQDYSGREDLKEYILSFKS